MKKVTITSAILFLFAIAKCQSYIPLDISPGTYWTTHHYNCCINAGAPACISNQYSEVMYDTIISTLNYAKIKMGYIDNNGSSNCFGSNYIETHLLRQDTLNKKIYERLWTGSDTLIIDYTQQVGDTCNLYYLKYPKTFIVTSIDSIFINGIYHRRTNYGTNQFSLIEGVGTTLGITNISYDFENNTELTCKGHNGIVQFPDTSITTITCTPLINLGIRNNKLTHTNILIYPNPTNAALFVELKNSIELHVKLYDRIGNIIRQETTNTGKVEIDVRQIPSGFYFIHIEDEKHNVYNDKMIIQ